MIAVNVVPGQASDSPLLEPMLDATLERAENLEELTGDKGFDGDRPREACLDRSVNPNIPNKRNRVNLWHFEPEPYRERNRIERLIGKAKQFRRLATRYEKLKATFLGLLQLVFGFIRLRRTVAVLNTA